MPGYEVIKVMFLPGIECFGGKGTRVRGYEESSEGTRVRGEL